MSFLLLLLPPLLAGEPLYAWCGPQPNSRLLLNYGIVDESNPYDKLALVVTLPANDPLYKVKRGILQVRLCFALWL
jgi:histone-lysine N-methyltransferase SETD3